MITQGEKQEIIDAIVEKFLLILPGVIGNLITHHVALSNVNKRFYDRYPKFKDHKDIVAATIEDIEGDGTFEGYEKLLEKAVPRIEKNIKIKLGLDMKTLRNPSPEIDLGEL